MSTLLTKQYPLWTVILSYVVGGVSIGTLWSWYKYRNNYLNKLDFTSTTQITHQIVNSVWYKYDVQRSNVCDIEDVYCIVHDICHELAINQHNILTLYVRSLSRSMNSSYTQQHYIHELLKSLFQRLAKSSHLIVPYLIHHIQTAQYAAQQQPEDQSTINSTADGLDNGVNRADDSHPHHSDTASNTSSYINIMSDDEESKQQHSAASAASPTKTRKPLVTTQQQPYTSQQPSSSSIVKSPTSSVPSNLTKSTPSLPPQPTKQQHQQSTASGLIAGLTGQQVASRIQTVNRNEFALLFTMWLENKIVNHVTVNLL